MYAVTLTVLGLALWQAPATEVARRLDRGYQLLDQGRLEEAHREFNAAVEADPKSVDGRILLGMASYHLRRDQEAVTHLEEALRLDPGSVQANYVLGMLYLRKENLEKSEKHLATAYAADLRRADILQTLSQVLMTRGDAPALARWLERGRAMGIENAGLLLSLGWAYSEMREFAKAEESVASGLRLSPQNKPGWLTLVKAQLQQGGAGRLRALETLERAREVPALAEGWQYPYLVGLTNYMLDRHDAAVGPLRRAVATAPHEDTIHLLLAICLTTIGEVDGAEQHYRRAIALEGRNALFHYYYGLLLRRQQKLEEAVGEFRTALNLDPKLAEAYLHIGLMLSETGKEAEAIQELEKAIAIAPDLARAYYALARIYTRRREADRAAAMMRRFQELKADEAKLSQLRILEGAMSALGTR